MSFLLYIASHWVLVVATVLAVIGLGVAAYVLKNLKFALAAIAIAIAGFMYQGAVMHGIQLQLAKDVAEQAEIANGRLKTLSDLTLKNAAQAKADQDKIDELESRASETPKNDGACLDADAASRVRAIGTERKPATTGTRRHSNMFPKRSR